MVILEGDRELFIGAKVTIDEKSCWYGSTWKQNPRDIVGRVVGLNCEEVDDDLEWWDVKWSNGERNTYQDGDLKVLGEAVNE